MNRQKKTLFQVDWSEVCKSLKSILSLWIRPRKWLVASAPHLTSDKFKVSHLLYSVLTTLSPLLFPSFQLCNHCWLGSFSSSLCWSGKSKETERYVDMCWLGTSNPTDVLLQILKGIHMVYKTLQCKQTCPSRCTTIFHSASMLPVTASNAATISSFNCF